MSEIINIFMFEELIKRREKIPLLGYNPNVPTKVNKFTIENGTLKSVVVGGAIKKNKIIVI